MNATISSILYWKYKIYQWILVSFVSELRRFFEVDTFPPQTMDIEYSFIAEWLRPYPLQTLRVSLYQNVPLIFSRSGYWTLQSLLPIGSQSEKPFSSLEVDTYVNTKYIIASVPRWFFHFALLGHLSLYSK